VDEVNELDEVDEADPNREAANAAMARCCLRKRLRRTFSLTTGCASLRLTFGSTSAEDETDDTGADSVANACTCSESGADVGIEDGDIGDDDEEGVWGCASSSSFKILQDEAEGASEDERLLRLGQEGVGARMDIEGLLALD